MIACILKIDPDALSCESAFTELDGIGESELSRLGKIKNRDRLAHSVYGLLSLKRAIGGELREISRDGHGRPYFISGDTDFNITHSYQLCAAAVCENARVGIDIERIVISRERQGRIADRFFSDGERKLLDAAENFDECFFSLWTKKEAAAKCIGTGLADIVSGDAESEDFFFWQYKVDCQGDVYMMTVCSDKDIEPEIIFEQNEISLKKMQE